MGMLKQADGWLHILYDLGLIAIDPASLKVMIAPKLKNSDYGHLAEATVRLPMKLEQQPSRAALKRHADLATDTWN